jgi:L-amino acid N-acyltransferase YncA
VIGDSNQAASIGVHKACGFEPAGNLKSIGFKFGRWLDTPLMQLALGPGATSPPPDEKPRATGSAGNDLH